MKGFDFYIPISCIIGEPRLTPKEIYNPRGVIFGLKLAKRNKWKRHK